MRYGAVADAGPLIHLAEIDSLGFCSLFDPLILPSAVYDELDRGGLPDEMQQLGHEIVEIEDTPMGSNKLEVGERQAIALADKRELLLLTDDLAARNAAIERGILQAQSVCQHWSVF